MPTPIATFEAGRATERITVERQTDQIDGLGQKKTHWAPIWNCWAEVQDLGGDEMIAARQVAANVTHRVTMRWYPEPFGPSYRVRHADRTYDVVYVETQDRRRDVLRVLAVERRTDA